MVFIRNSVTIKKLNYLLPLIGVALLIRVLWGISWEQFGSVVQGFSPLFVILSGLLAMGGQIFKAVRWILMPVDGNIRMSLLVYFRALLYGLVTPGRVGELLKIKFLLKLGISTRDAVIYTIFERSFDLLFLGISGLFVILSYYYRPHWSWWMVILAVLAMQGMLSVKFVKGFGWIKFLLQWFVTIISYIVYASGFSLLLSNSWPPLWDSIPMVWVGNLIALIPVAWHGLGTREQFYLFVFQEYQKEYILGVSLIHFTLALTFCIGFCVLMIALLGKPEKAD
jgi:hypothetical protein